MKNSTIILFVLIYIFFSAFLEMGFGGRIVFADIFLVGLMLFSFYSVVLRRFFIIPSVYMAALPVFFIFLLGGILSINPDRSAFELFVIFFSFCGSIAIVNLIIEMPDIWLRRFAQGYVLVIGLMSFVCLIDFFFLPGLISSRQLGGIQGPFRNTGQAGSFFGVHAVIVLSLLMSRVVPRDTIYQAAVIFTILSLFFTLKRASIAAFVVGLIILMLMMLFSKSRRDKMVGATFLLGVSFFGVLGLLLFNWALDAIPGLRWRFEYKYSVDTLDTFSDGFLAENIEAAFAAFKDSPFLGVGLDNVRDIYMSHEIHSTYLGLLAYGGLFGIVAYVFFMGNLIYQMYREARFRLANEWASFLYYLLPLLLGQMVGWAYTPHYRKREFWILMFFVAVAIFLSRKLRRVGGQIY